MAIEIERRFLVQAPSAALSGSTIIQRLEIRQGYLGWVRELRIRVRISVDKDSNRSAMLSLKSRRRGICRQEYDHTLDLDCAEHILACVASDRIVLKTRYLICDPAGLTWSIDFFKGLNEGLVIAEVELSDPEQRVELPPWVGKEITFDPRYGNSALARSPIGASQPPVRRWGTKQVHQNVAILRPAGGQQRRIELACESYRTSRSTKHGTER
jgi:CYTH domain-containing protein